MFDLRLLGTTDLQLDGRPASSVLAQPKRLGILVYLALAQPYGFHRRDTLLALFWPEADAAHARHALSQALYHLRRSLGDAAILTRGEEEIGLDWSLWHCDVLTFREDVAAGRLEHALSLYESELLAGFHVAASPEFDQWLDGQRRSTREAAFAAGLELAARAEYAHRWEETESWLRRAAAISPLDELPVRRRMELLERAGERAAALAVYGQYSRLLTAELETEPSETLCALASRIRAAKPGDLPRAGDPPGTREPAPRRSFRGFRRWTVTGGGLLLVLTGVAVVFRFGGTSVQGLALFDRGVLEEGATLVVAEFENRTTDSTLAMVVTDALRTDLQQSSVVRVVGPAELRSRLELMQRPATAALDAEVAREIAVRDGIEAVLEGSVGSAGSGYVLNALVITPADGRTLLTVRENARSGEEVIAAIDRLSEGVRRKLGESARHIRRTPPLADVTTASLEALQLYTAAQRANRAGGPDASEKYIALMERAAQVDTNFVAAYKTLGASYINRGQPAKAARYLTRVHQLLDRLPARERYLAEGTYHRLVSGDRARAIAVLSTHLQLVGADTGLTAISALEQLGLLYQHNRQYARAEEMWRRRVAIRGFDGKPAPNYAYANVAIALTAQGRWQEALQVLQEADEAWPDSYAVEIACAVYALKGAGAADSAIRAWLGRRLAVDSAGNAARSANIVLSWLATLEGRLAEGERLMRASFARPLHIPIFLSEGDVFIRLDPHRAWVRLQAAFPRSRFDSIPPLERQYPSLILALSHAGHTREARALLAEFEREVPDSVRYMARYGRWMDNVRGELALAEGRAEDALRYFTAAQTANQCVTCVLPPVARAWERLGQRDSAIAVYERYLAPAGDWDRIYFDGMYLAFIFERLGELYAQRGERVRAAGYYRRLVELWANADPELQPRVRHARARITELAGGTARGAGEQRPAGGADTNLVGAPGRADGLSDPAPLDQAHDDHDDGDDQENVYESAHGVGGDEPQHPEGEQDDYDGPHMSLADVVVTGALGFPPGVILAPAFVG